MLTFKVLSALLHYPDAQTVEALDEMASVLDREALLPTAERAGVQAFMDYLADTDLLESQALYVNLFDRARSLSLHLYEHIHGESRDRGQAMVNLVNHYRANGLEIDGGELPDYLPLFLEFLSTQPLEDARRLLGETVDIVSLLAERLRRRQAPYRELLLAVATLAARRPHEAEVRRAVDGEKPDDTAEALDAAWEEAPVTFNDAPHPDPCNAGCSAAAAMVARFTPVAGGPPRRPPVASEG